MTRTSFFLLVTSVVMLFVVGWICFALIGTLVGPEPIYQRTTTTTTIPALCGNKPCPPPSSSSPAKTNSNLIGIVVGSIVGGIVLLLLVVVMLILVCVCRKRRKEERHREETMEKTVSGEFIERPPLYTDLPLTRINSLSSYHQYEKIRY